MLELFFQDKPMKLFETNNLGELINAAGWVNDPVRGWYKDQYTWTERTPLKLPPGVLEGLRRIEATFTGYYNTPAGCIGLNVISLNTDGPAVSLGTDDPWDYGPSGQQIYRGDLGNQLQIQRDVIQERLGYNIPIGTKINSIVIGSTGYNGNGINYPMSLRGMKNFKFWYR